MYLTYDTYNASSEILDFKLPWSSVTWHLSPLLETWSKTTIFQSKKNALSITCHVCSEVKRKHSGKSSNCKNNNLIKATETIVLDCAVVVIFLFIFCFGLSVSLTILNGI